MPANTEELLKMPRKMLKVISNDPVKTAEAVNLVYVTDAQPGIVRVRRGKKFYYVKGKEKLTDPKSIQRIQESRHSPCLGKRMDLYTSKWSFAGNGYRRYET